VVQKSKVTSTQPKPTSSTTINQSTQPQGSIKQDF